MLNQTLLALPSDNLWQDAKSSFHAIQDIQAFVESYSLYQYLGAQTWAKQYNSSRLNYYAAVVASGSVSLSSRLFLAIGLSFRTLFLELKGTGQSALAGIAFVKEKALSGGSKIAAMIEKWQAQEIVKPTLKDNLAKDPLSQKAGASDPLQNQRKGSFNSIALSEDSDHELELETASPVQLSNVGAGAIGDLSNLFPTLDASIAVSRSRTNSERSVETVVRKSGSDDGTPHVIEESAPLSEEQLDALRLKIVYDFYQSKDPKYTCYSTVGFVSGLRARMRSAIENGQDIAIDRDSAYRDFVDYYNNYYYLDQPSFNRVFGPLVGEKKSPDNPARKADFVTAVKEAVQKLRSENPAAKRQSHPVPEKKNSFFRRRHLPI